MMMMMIIKGIKEEINMRSVLNPIVSKRDFIFIHQIGVENEDDSITRKLFLSFNFSL
ncbi:hypothetical protein LguiA_035259 [Lonicera macranthoides]